MTFKAIILTKNHKTILRQVMFQNNNPDYYNDAVKNARVNSDNVEQQSNSKGKLLLILNLLLISAILGYFIYKNMETKQETAVKGVNYTVDIREEKSIDTINNLSKTAETTIVITPPIKEKEKENVKLENLIDNSKEDDSAYIQALGDELTRISSKKVEDSQQNKKLENILANIDTEGFSETTNVVKIDNEPEIIEDLDINALANIIDSIVSEEQSPTLSYEEQLAKVIPVE